MPPSHGGWLMARFPNNSHAQERLALNHTCPFCANAGKLVAIPSLSYIANCWFVAIQSPMSRCMTSLFACAPLGKKHAGKGTDLAPTPVSSRQATFLFLRRSLRTGDG